MHIEVARNRSILANPQETGEHKAAARSALESIAAEPSDRRSLDARLVLSELGYVTGDGQPASTETVQQTVSTYDVLGGLGPVEDDPLSFSLPARSLAPDSPNYDPHTKRWADECQRSKERGEISNIYRYWLPRLYQDSYSFPRERTSVPGEIFADYLPYKWLTWELFVEMQEALRPNPSKSYFEQLPIDTRVAPHIERWRRVKKEWEATNGPTRECLSDVLFDPYTDCAEARKS